jgi:hypothetical protein
MKGREKRERQREGKRETLIETIKKVYKSQLYIKYVL